MPKDQITSLADALLRLQLGRSRHLADPTFAMDYPFGLLLALFLADSRGQRVTGRMILTEVGCRLDTGERWLHHFTEQGYIVGDGSGDLDDPLTLTPMFLHALEQWLHEAHRQIGTSVFGLE